MGYDAATGSPFVLIAAAPDEPRADRLALELEQIGWQVVLARTPAAAARAPQAVACLVVLRAASWNAPAIVATVRARPRLLIPVLAEPMGLPAGPWTEAPIEMRLSPAAIARQIDEVIADLTASGPPASFGQSSPGSGQSPPAFGQSQPRFGQSPPAFGQSQPRFGQSPPPFRRSQPGFSPPRRPSVPLPEEPSAPYRAERYPAEDRYGDAAPPRFSAPLNGAAPDRADWRPPEALYGGAPATTLAPPRRTTRAPWRMAALAATLLTILGIIIFRSALVLGISHLLGGTSSAANTTAYTAAKPGPNCDHGGANWALTANSNLTVTCVTNGTQLVRNGATQLVGEVIFTGKGGAFPQSYRVAANATITGGDAYTGVGLGVHGQQQGGAQLFLARANTTWQVLPYANTGALLPTLDVGFLARPTTTFALSVEVHGPQMIFTINGQAVSTVTDTTYATTQDLYLALSEPTAQTTATAVFSNFSYTPLPNPTLPANQVAATATAQAATALQQAYKAAVPGPGCDHGAGKWAAPVVYGDAVTTTTCTANGLVIAQNNANTFDGQVGFYWLTGAFPKDYTLGVTVNLSAVPTGSCASLFTRVSDTGAYGYFLCAGGRWLVVSQATDGTITVLRHGAVAARAVNTLATTDKGAAHTFVINGVTVASFSDATQTATDDVELSIVATQQGAKIAATFSNFVFTPLP